MQRKPAGYHARLSAMLASAGIGAGQAWRGSWRVWELASAGVASAGIACASIGLRENWPARELACVGRLKIALRQACEPLAGNAGFLRWRGGPWVRVSEQSWLPRKRP